MANPTYVDGYLLTISRDPLVLDLAWKRDQTVSLQFYTPAKAVADLSPTGTSATLTLRRRPYETTSLLSRNGTIVGGGVVQFAFTSADLATLVWDLGQKFQVLWMDVSVALGGSGAKSCFDDAGRRQFPVYVHQSIKDDP